MKNSIRQNRTRYRLKKVSDRKRLSIFKSNNHIYAQIINDEIGKTLASVSSLEKIFKNKKNFSKKIQGRNIPRRITSISKTF